MQAILGSVGEGAANATSDVALVQAILVKTQRAAQPARAATASSPAVPARPAAPYLASYNGTYGPATGDAIRAFQADHVFRSPTGETVANPRATAGTVAPGDATWTALVATVPAAFRDLRVLVGHRTVYVQATAAQLQAKLNHAAGCTFTDAFRVKVNATIRRMHTDHGIAIGVDPQGDRRTFQAQYALRTSGRGVTNAGPGESNHNFGGAADLGFEGLRWLRANGAVVENENPWLAELHRVSTTEEGHFWDALRTAGIASGAFRGPVGDRPHLQNWADANVSMRARLAAHLTRSGTMRWSADRGTYSSDLGFGGARVPVGTAVQIWAREATVDAATIARLRAAAPPRPGQPPQRPGQPPQRPGQPPARPGAPPADPRAAAAAEVEAMRNALRHEFDLADQNWRAWTDR